MHESDSSVYRDLSVEMRDGLKGIYQQISSAAAAGHAGNPEAMFSDASDQLKEVVRATESAAMDIMEIVEKQLAQTEAVSSLLESLQRKLGDDPDLQMLAQYNIGLSNDLTSVLTSLSFQDIAGQRIKKVMSALAAMEESVVELYLSSGLVIEAADKDPARDTSSIKADTQKAMEEYRENRGSELKGPDKNGISQAAIDDMLAQLGL